PADVVADLEEADAERANHPAGGDQRVECVLGLEMILRLPDVDAVHPGELLGHPAGELRMTVDARADRRSTERQIAELMLGIAQPLDRLRHLAGVALELLAEPNRRRVLEVRPTRLDDGPEFLLLLVQRVPQLFAGG